MIYHFTISTTSSFLCLYSMTQQENETGPVDEDNLFLHNEKSSMIIRIYNNYKCHRIGQWSRSMSGNPSIQVS